MALCTALHGMAWHETLPRCVPLYVTGRLLTPNMCRYERTLTVSSLGKTFSCTGWKIGTIVGPEHLVKVRLLAGDPSPVARPGVCLTDRVVP